MKKKIILFALIAVISAGAAFADHPKGFGIGAIAGYGNGWEGGGSGTNNWALALKVPSVPIFWAIDLELDSYYFQIGLRGDYYFIDKTLVKDINLGWYLGVGGWFSYGSFDSKWANWTYMAAGARVPIGLSWQPIDLLEIFLEIAPSLGIQFSPDFHFPAGGWGAGFGFRLWF
jgi:hypothetical protein